MSQTAVTVNMDAAFPGMLADISKKVVESYVSGESSAEIPFGSATKQKPGAAFTNSALLPVLQADTCNGILLHSHMYSVGGNLPELGSVGVKPKAPLNILRQGRVYVRLQTGESVVKGDRAFWHIVDQAWRNSADGTDTVDLTAQCEFRSTTGSGGVAILEVDFVNLP